MALADRAKEVSQVIGTKRAHSMKYTPNASDVYSWSRKMFIRLGRSVCPGFCGNQDNPRPRNRRSR
ncbi:hypothetical protein I7I50_00354 [Histoplasma capsulatum G186AR]|uniref:Uncharacterized protein n=1 Tax=Ajellomyces capsulatus TaxID=5037 RepID=A0A8H7YJA8_AJECA|nr:hypothetical protein I7I52_07622 [Histoplasma capsulatum]QSS72492.1 hypothetical protein I7I50_00354 [Histoplasma capsulatum G186AR]